MVSGLQDASLDSNRGESSRAIPQGLAVHSFGYLGGFVGAGTTRACPSPFDIFSLMDLTAANGLAGVEVPPAEYLTDLRPENISRVKEYAEKRRLYIVFDTGPANAAELSALIPVAKELSVRVIRVTASLILCGERRTVKDTWSQHISGIVGELRAVRGQAEEAGVTIAVENHQDLTADELVEICAGVGGRNIGVTLDSLNPLAVVEEPLAYARRLGALIKNVHLKDYKLYNTRQGFRLVRCGIGEGVLDVPGLMSVLKEVAPDATTALELAALHNRHVQFLDEGYWTGFPPRRLETILPVLRLRDERGLPDSQDWRTPWEKEASHEEMARYEMDQFYSSVEYLRRVQ